jgi:LacI family transcriptional regulator
LPDGWLASNGAEFNVFNPMDGIPGLKEVAARARVSVATVSMALRDDPRITERTRARVRAAARVLGYESSPLVSAFMARVRKSGAPRYREPIAYLHTLPRTPLVRQGAFRASLYKGAQARAQALGFKLEPFWLTATDMAAPRLSRMLETRGVRGVIVPPLGPIAHPLVLAWERFAAVAIGYTLQEPRLHRVVPDHDQGMHTCLVELRALGYRRLGLVLDIYTQRRVQHKWSATFLWEQQAIPPEQRVPVLIVPHRDRDAVLAWVRAHQPDVIVSPHEDIVGWLQEAGREVPGQMGFCHLNLHDAFGECSGLDQRPELLGAAAVNVVVSQFAHNERGVPEAPQTISFEGRFVPGKSTAPPPESVQPR